MLMELPYELIYTIADHLPPRDILNFRNVCKQIHNILEKENSAIILGQCLTYNSNILSSYSINFIEYLKFIQEIFENYNVRGPKIQRKYGNNDPKLFWASRRSRTVDALVPTQW